MGKWLAGAAAGGVESRYQVSDFSVQANARHEAVSGLIDNETNELPTLNPHEADCKH